MTDKFFGIVSLSRKAGKLTYGFDAVKDTIYSGEAELVLYAQDVSQRTKTSMDKVIGEGNKPTPSLSTQLTMYDYAQICGKAAGVLAVTDAGLAAAISEVFAKTSNELRED
ncbi:MAG: ribosomal L7Ae/L30e/S12e/Gadd45 family protein [Angelakisella sp.]